MLDGRSAFLWKVQSLLVGVDLLVLAFCTPVSTFSSSLRNESLCGVLNQQDWIKFDRETAIALLGNRGTTIAHEKSSGNGGFANGVSLSNLSVFCSFILLIQKAFGGLFKRAPS